jgi:5-methylcytosine-specific restriction endonuclease McrA
VSLAALNSDVLVLNRVYVAIHVINVRRAFSLLARALAEVISTEGQDRFVAYDFQSWQEVSEVKRQFEAHRHEWVRTIRSEIAAPRVVRLLRYDRIPRMTVQFNRRNIYARDHNRCQYCGRHLPTSELSLDHVIPRSRGGDNSWENIVCCCLKCNVRKGGRTPHEARMRLVKRPTKPKRPPLLGIRTKDWRYECWQAFLDEAYWSAELEE